MKKFPHLPLLRRYAPRNDVIMSAFLCVAVLLWTAPVLANGLAMHGEPKYGPDAPHLSYANPDAPKGGKLTYGHVGSFDTLNPFSIKGGAARGLDLTTDRLMIRVWDEAFTMYPLVAESVDMPEDRSSATFHLNPNARFHDGSAITADDILFSFETLRDHGRPNMRRIYRLVENAQIKDPRTITFSFGEGHDRETVMILAMMPVLSKIYWEGKTFDSSTLEPPLSSGPYKIKTVDPGRSITYERVKDYWAKDLFTSAGHYNFDKITYDYYRDDNVFLEAFKAGEIDLRREYDAGKWISNYKNTNKDIIKAEIPHGRPEPARGFIFNTRRAPFDDIRVRQALSLLFDFEWANKNLFHGKYKRTDSYFANSELSSQSDSTSKAAAPKSNRQKLHEVASLLDQAGYSVESGKRIKDGRPLSFEILLTDAEDEKLALHFKRSLDKAGIAANIRLMDGATYQNRMNEYDFDMTINFWRNSLSPGTEQVLYWSCEAANTPASFNYAGVCDPEIDRLATSIASAKTRQELVESAKTLDARLLEGTYMIPLYYSGKDLIAYWSQITRPSATPIYGPVLETWWTKAQNAQ